MRQHPATIASFALCAFLLLGCEEGVDPVLGTDQAFTVYGFFNPRADTQAMRIFPVEDRLVRTGPEPIDALVTSENLTTGATHAWRDSVVFFSSNLQTDVYGHIYFTPFRADYEHTYRLSVRRSDAAEAQVTVTVPPLSVPELVETGPVPPLRARIPVFWPGAPMLNHVEVVYHLAVDNVPTDYVVAYTAEEWERVEGGIVVTVQFTRDTQVMRREVNNGRGGTIILQEVEQRALVTNREWDPPDGTYDPERLVQPGTFSNVQNGFGFVGAGYPASIFWLPDASLLRALGYTVPEERPEETADAGESG